MRINSAGNVSIGSDGTDYGRSYRMVARHDQNATTQIAVINGTVGAGAATQITKIGGTSFSFLDWTLSDNNGAPYDSFAYGSAVGGVTWSFGGFERVRITSAGNVGIGTSSPGDKLEIGGAGAGIILASPNGTRYRITVSNLGVLTVAAV
jgi:hypothetical protein